MKPGIKSIFNPIARMSISAKFGVMMGGFMLLLAAAMVATFWTANLQKDDAKVINIAGRQRMLSQKMTKEAMALIQGKAKKSDIMATAELFDRSLGDLISGNSEAGIPPTRDLNIKAQLNKVQNIWRAFRLNMEKLADLNDERQKVYSVILSTNVPLLNDINDAVFMMEQEDMDAKSVNIAGRQRMLSQKMAKEALALEGGTASEKEILATVALFDKSLDGLINGSNDLGLKAMKSSAILAQLRKVEERWKPFKANMERLAEIAAPAGELRGYLLGNDILLLKEMNGAVELYETASTGKVRDLKIIQLALLTITIFFFAFGWLFVTNPIVKSFTSVADELEEKSKDIATVTAEITEGAKSQTGMVQAAAKDLEEMIINVIQGNMTMSVEKQSEISKAFGDFLKHFVERTSAEIAMGMMSVSQQSQEARSSMQDFMAELVTVETNIRSQENATEQIVEALKSIVAANEEIKIKAQVSTKAADLAASKAVSGQERMKLISGELQEIKNSSEGVKDITESLATITESIKILALNMSLKVEDIKDDTGKSYGFEAMSAKVQQLAEEVEGLLAGSKSMIIPTIEGIAKVTAEAAQATNMIIEVAASIKTADEESKAITDRISKQAADIDRVEIEAENLRALAHKTTGAIEAQDALVKDVDTILKDSGELIESVGNQTRESADSARKINEMMDQLKETMASIENGTGKLTEKSTQIMDVFDSINALASKNRSGAERLEGVSTAVRGASRNVSDVVKGASA